MVGVKRSRTEPKPARRHARTIPPSRPKPTACLVDEDGERPLVLVNVRAHGYSGMWKTSGGADLSLTIHPDDAEPLAYALLKASASS